MSERSIKTTAVFCCKSNFPQNQFNFFENLSHFPAKAFGPRIDPGLSGPHSAVARVWHSTQREAIALIASSLVLAQKARSVPNAAPDVSPEKSKVLRLKKLSDSP